MLRLLSLLIVLNAVVVTPVAAQTVVLDPSFGTGGVATPFVGEASAAYDALLLDDGSIVLAGQISEEAGIIRLTSGGLLDTSFGTEGSITFSFPDRTSYVSDVARLPDGRLLVVGGVSNLQRNAIDFSFAARTTANGVLDPSFNDDGLFTAGFSGSSAVFGNVELLPDGRILIVASAAGEGISMARFEGNGDLDLTFGTNGVATINLPVSVNDALLLGDGRLLLSGIQTEGSGTTVRGDAVLVRVTTSGALDMAFGTNGVALVDLGGHLDYFFGISLDTDGRIVVAGTSSGTLSDSDASTAVVARFTSAGRLDTSFGDEGVAVVTGQARGSATALRPDGRIVLTGTRNDISPLVAQLTSSGVLDVSFGSGGIADVDAGSEAVTLDGAVYPDGDLLISGYTYSTQMEEPRSMLALRLTTQTVAAEGGPSDVFGLQHAGQHPSLRPRLRLTLDRPQAVRVEVVDALGRAAAHLYDGTLGAGTHVFGGPAGLAPGLYVARAVGEAGETSVLPVVIVR